MPPTAASSAGAESRGSIRCSRFDRPARSTVGVAALPAGAAVEIECLVYDPKRSL